MTIRTIRSEAQPLTPRYGISASSYDFGKYFLLFPLKARNDLIAHCICRMGRGIPFHPKQRPSIHIKRTTSATGKQLPYQLSQGRRKRKPHRYQPSMVGYGTNIASFRRQCGKVVHGDVDVEQMAVWLIGGLNLARGTMNQAWKSKSIIRLFVPYFKHK